MREASARERGTTAAGPGPLRVRLRINGEDRRAGIEPRTTLAEALGGPDLGLTGTKIVCSRGACSACTVWIDGATYCSSRFGRRSGTG